MPEGMIALRDEGLMRIASSEFHGVRMMGNYFYYRFYIALVV